MAKKKSSKKKKLTPLMAQYNRIKSKYSDAILLFRVGDFYETFGEDAVKTAEVTGIVLTKRNNGKDTETELAGFPHHALETYLPKLVKAGYRIAICDQLEDASASKNIVKRGVTELITPGVALNDKLLDHKSNNFLAAVCFNDQKTAVAFLDISTGEFYLAEGSTEYIDKLLNSLQPSEVIFSRNHKKQLVQAFGEEYYTYALEEWIFDYDFAYDKLIHHFGTNNLKGFGVEELSLAIICAGACLHYLAETEHPEIDHISKLARIEEDNYVWIDRFTVRNLELVQPQHPGGVTLLDIIDKTVTPMGSRLLKRWTVLPLKSIPAIRTRLAAVESLFTQPEKVDQLTDLLKQMGDLERLVSKIASQKAGPRDIQQLRYSLETVEPVKEICEADDEKAIQHLGENLLLCTAAKEIISTTLKEDVPALLSKGNVIADGVDEQLDELRDIAKNGKQKLTEIQQREAKKTGINSLKIGFNNVFGYYLEVTNKYKNDVPEEWLRKQTLTNSERYITDELKQLEDKILGAEEKLLDLEQQLFAQLVEELHQYIQSLQQNAFVLAQIDCLLSFAIVSKKNNYTRPEIHDGLDINIKDGRHPVIEQQLPLGEQYVPNDTYLNNQDQQIIIITGPNMSGKSAILRQTALIVLLAQMGCFVPASSASIGLVDKLFTRVGASDNLSMGESTFMVEMLETSSIMNNVSERSLILLDEIGRGTSTYDGVSIAWSIAEYLHQNEKVAPKTLFATHYHELNELAKTHERIKNFHVQTREINQKIIFLRKLVEGGSQHSFGIHVAKLAGMPPWIVQRADTILSELEASRETEQQQRKESLNVAAKTNQYQLSIFDMADPKQKEILEELQSIDVNALTPIEAMMKLNEIKQKLNK